MRLARPGKGPPTLNLTPMIDVVFLLIIFFLVATTFYRTELEMTVDLPEASETQAISEPTGEIVINVLADGPILVKGKEMTLEALGSLLAEASEADPDQAVIIRGDGESRHETIVRVMDACVGASITRVSIGVVQANERSD